MAFCLIKTDAAKLLKAFKDGSIDPGKLAEMTSEERNTFFQKYTSKENATKVNALFESKQLLKNQKQGYITWAKQITGISSAAKRDIITRIQKMERVLSPQENEQFLKDLAQTKLGLGVSQTEAKTIFDLAKEIETNKKKADENGVFKSQEDRLAYGKSVVALENYINDLKLDAKRIRFKEQPVKKILEAVLNVPGTMKSLIASLDNSFWGRQGVKTLLDIRTSPTWVKNFLKSFGDIGNSLRGKNVIDLVRADIYSRPNSINGKYKAGGYGLDVLTEEAFPVSFPEKIPLLGRLYTASQDAYNAGALKLRADLADRMIKIGESNGLDMNNRKDAEGFGRLVSNLTGRGSLGKADAISKELNVLFFSAKFLKSNIDVLTAHMTDPKVRENAAARKEAIKSTMSIVATLATVLTLANFFDDEMVEDDPRSTNFGKLKLFGKWVDITGGMAGLVTLASRLVPTKRNGEWGFWYKNSQGNYTKLGTQYGGLTALDVAENFLQGKLSPVAGVVRDVWKGKDFAGNKVTPQGVVIRSLTPISVQNYKELLKDGNVSPFDLIGLMTLDMLGASVSTYLPSQFNWESSETKTLTQFKEKVGDKKFKEANDKFNDEYAKWLEKTTSSQDYKSLSDEAKQTVRTNGKSTLQEKILKEYGFKYQSKTKTPEEKKEQKVVKDIVNTINK